MVRARCKEIGDCAADNGAADDYGIENSAAHPLSSGEILGGETTAAAGRRQAEKVF
jgi:hypothetical protein